MRAQASGIHEYQPVSAVGVGCALAVLSVLGACSVAAGPSSQFKPLPDKFTRATLVGPLCDGALCTCVTPGADAGLPDRPNLKRYQLRLGPAPNELWVMIDGMVLYKSVERATDCFIIDLHAGKHDVVLRASGEQGLAAGLTVNEIGPKGTYNTLDFHCGGPGTCSFDQLQVFKASLAKYRRGVHDPCGSTRIRTLEWLTGKSPDRVHPGELQLQFVLDVYDFPPRHESGHPDCKDRF